MTSLTVVLRYFNTFSRFRTQKKIFSCDLQLILIMEYVSDFFLFSFIFQLYVCLAYKPVFIIHGVLSANLSMVPLANRIKEMHPGTKVYISSRYDGWASLEPMWVQTRKFGEDVLNLSKTYPDGIHIIGYSQGGLVARAVLEKFPKHNVHTFISLSSPQAGQYGTQFLEIAFPNLVRDKAYKLFYSVAGQLTSVGNYWNDPHQQDLYYSYSAFLPLLNNEKIEKRNESFREGLTKLKKVVLIGGPDDGVITPWQSSLFGYYDSEENIVDLRDRNIYCEDYIGLKHLDQKKKLKLITVTGVRHFFWRKNISVIDNFILPYLD